MRPEISLGAFIFIFHCSAGVLVQTVLPHLAPSAHLGDGMFIGDAKNIHDDAVLMATRDERKIFSWEYLVQKCHDPERPVGTLFAWLVGIIYSLTWPNPLVLLPLLALLQTGAGICFFKTLKLSGLSQTSSLVGGLWMGCWPTTLEWSTQLLREGFFVFGMTLIFFALVSKKIKKAFLALAVGFTLVFFARPPWTKVLLMQGLMILFLYFSRWAVCKKKGPACKMSWLSSAAMVGISLIGLVGSSHVKNTAGLFKGHRYEDGHVTFPSYRTSAGWPLRLYDFVGRQIYGCRSTQMSSGGSSLVHPEKLLNSADEQILYLPQALLTSLLAPSIFIGGERVEPQNKIRIQSLNPEEHRISFAILQDSPNLAGITFRILGKDDRGTPLFYDATFSNDRYWQKQPRGSVLEILFRPSPHRGAMLPSQVYFADQTLFTPTDKKPPTHWTGVELLSHAGSHTTGLLFQSLYWLMSILSLILAGLLAFLIFAKKDTPLAFLVITSLVLLGFLAMVCPNLGTLVRIRFVYWSLVFSVGLGWLLDQGLNQKEPR